MRNPFNSRKRIAVVAAGAAVLLGGVTALAYWTTSGSGTGTGSATTGVTGDLTFSQNSLTAMFPGDSSQALTVTVANPDTQAVYVTTVKAYLTVTKAGGAPAGSCDSSDFLLNGVAAPGTLLLAAGLTWTAGELAGSGGHANATGTVQFNDKVTNQDACKGASVTLNYVAS